MSENNEKNRNEEAFKKKVIFGLVTISVLLAALYALIRCYR
jgi:hypothetical protein